MSILKTIYTVLVCGLLICSAGRMNLHAQTLEALIGDFSSTDNPDAKMDLLLPIIDSLTNRYDMDQALIYSKLAVQIAEEQNSDRYRVEAYMRISNTYTEKQLFGVAEDYALQVVEISGEIGDKLMEAHGNNMLSYIYDTQGEYRKCLQSSVAAAELFEEAGDYTSMAYAYNDIGVVQYYMGEDTLAEEYYLKAQKIFEREQDDRGVSVCKNNLANIYSDQGLLDKALGLYEEALAFDIENDDKYGQSVDLSNIGETYTSLGDYDKASENLRKSLSIAIEIEDTWSMTNPLNGLSNMFYEMGLMDSSLYYAKKSLELSRQIGAREEASRSIEHLYEIYRDVNMLDSALHYHELLTTLRDSMYDAEKAASIYEMQERFNSKNRLKELKLVQQEKAMNDLQHKQDIAERQNKENMLTLGLALGAALIAFVGFGFIVKRKDNRKLQRQKSKIEETNAELEVAYDEIEEKNRDILDSIKYAQRIQDAMLPPGNLLKSEFPNSFILFKPRDIVSGDFYWLYKSNDHLFVAVADCTGHGVPGAFVSMLCSNVLSQIIIENDIHDCGQILSDANKRVGQALQQKSSAIQSKDGMDICIAKINVSNCELEYAGAMNTVWMVQNDTMISGESDRTPIGGRTSMDYVFTTHKTSLRAGDRIFLYTDGFQDQFGGERGKKFKSSRLKEILANVDKDQFSHLAEHLNSVFEEWRGDIEQIDDVCLIGINL